MLACLEIDPGTRREGEPDERGSGGARAGGHTRQPHQPQRSAQRDSTRAIGWRGQRATCQRQRGARCTLVDFSYGNYDQKLNHSFAKSAKKCEQWEKATCHPSITHRISFEQSQAERPAEISGSGAPSHCTFLRMGNQCFPFPKESRGCGQFEMRAPGSAWPLLLAPLRCRCKRERSALN